MEINERIFFLLDKQGKTAKELGDFIKVNPSSISGWKNEGISEFFNVSIEYLFTGHEANSLLDKDQQELVDTYCQLDRRGQHRVHTIIYEELDRIASSNNSRKNIV